MVLRRPYAFFIKHFKLFHIFLSAFFVYSIIRITGVINFVNNYLDSNLTLITANDVKSVFGLLDFLLPIIGLIFCILLLTVMSLKKKPNKFYIIATITTIVLLITNIYGYSTLEALTTRWLEVNRLNTLADIYFFVMIASILCGATSISRAIGFNISRFDFNNDILQFDLSDEDNAEFEVVVDFDVNDLKRVTQKKLRYFRYFIKENRLTLIWTCSVVAVTILLFTVFHFMKYSKKVVKTNLLSFNGFSFFINNAYIIDDDLQGNKLIDNTHLLVIDATITNTGFKTDKEFITGTISINIGDDNYNSTKKYEDVVTDLGKIYNDEKIKSNASVRSLLVFEIPENHLKSKILLGAKNLANGSTTYTKVKPIDISNNKSLHVENKLGEEMNLKDSTIGETKIVIDDYNISTKFKVNYNFCVSSNKCINSTEYLVPSNDSNYEKAILRLTGNFQFEENSLMNDFYKLFIKFGYIEYTIGNQTYHQDNMFKEIKSNKVKQNNIYYIEVLKDIQKADNIYLGLKIRNMDYRYHLKKENG